jgi:hypothetical protein
MKNKYSFKQDRENSIIQSKQSKINLNNLSIAYQKNRRIYLSFLGVIGLILLFTLLFALSECILKNEVLPIFMLSILTGFRYLCSCIFLFTMAGGPGSILILLWHLINQTALCLKKKQDWTEVFFLLVGLLILITTVFFCILTFHHYTAILNQ